MISIKKLAVTGAAAGLLLAAAVPAFAGESDLNIRQKNWAEVTNNVTGSSSTGNNQIKASGDVEHAKIKTGDATTLADVTNVLNSNSASVKNCGCFEDVRVKQKNGAEVSNTVSGSSSTGGNKIKSWGGEVEHAKIKTGDALTGASVSNILNSNVVTVGSSD